MNQESKRDRNLDMLRYRFILGLALVGAVILGITAYVIGQ